MEKRVFNLPEQKDARRLLRSYATPAERRLWLFLKQRKFFGLKFRRQHGIGQYIVDFYCPEKKLVIEVDGDSHYVPGAAAYDVRRQQYLINLGLRVLRFRNDEVRLVMDRVLEQPKNVIDDHP